MDLIEKSHAPSSTVLKMLAQILSPQIVGDAQSGRYDRLVDAANRLPRPALVFGTIALLLFAMIDPAGFARRMAALQSAPVELWWLVGGVIAGHFGAREAHHLRHRTPPAPPESQRPDQPI